MSTAPLVLAGRYEVGGIIGRGGMADVHLGHDNRLGRTVAIKMLRSDLARDANFLTRFRREAQSAAGLNHPSIVAIFDSGEDEATDEQGNRRVHPYIVMEYVDGETLRDRVGVGGRLAPLEAITMTEGVLDALAYSHRMGIVHRDIKPANVMITQSGRVKVMDFGIARAIADTAATMTQTQSVVGTAQYLSPEQATGQTVDARTDLYSTGCMLFELLTGRAPFIGDSPLAIAYQHVEETPQPPSVWNDEVGGDLDAVTLHALTKDREARYQDAAAFRDDLENVRLGRPISAAARGAGAAIGGAATQTLPSAYATAGAPTMVQPAVADPADPPTGDTASLPAVGHDVTDGKDRRGGGGRAALVTILVLAVLGLVGWGAVNWYNSQQPQVIKVTVPRLTGLTEQQAGAALTQSHLQGDATRAVNEAPEGQVFDQDPEAGNSVNENSVVSYTISSGPESVAVPDVTGSDRDEAVATLREAGFTDLRFVTENDPTQPKDRVIKTTPPARQAVSTSTRIDIHVATGNVIVPTDLVGQDWAEAPVRFAPLQLRAKKVDVETTDQPDGTILEVAKAGSAVPTGTEIEVKVAKAPPPSPSVTTETATITVTQPPTVPDGSPTTPPPAANGNGNDNGNGNGNGAGRNGNGHGNGNGNGDGNGNGNGNRNG